MIFQFFVKILDSLNNLLSSFDVGQKKIEDILELIKFENLQELETKKGFEESMSGRFFRSGKIDSWKNILSKNQVSKIENKFGDVMQELGYL